MTIAEGEINHYFCDNENAFTANQDDPNNFAEKMKTILEIPLLGDQIGENGFHLGFTEFNYQFLKKMIFDFFKQMAEINTGSQQVAIGEST